MDRDCTLIWCDCAQSATVSFASEDAIFAMDLSKFLGEIGFSVYVSDDENKRHVAGSDYKKRLMKIYKGALVNVVIWSRHYAEREKDSFVAIERDFLIKRHCIVRKMDQLYILSMDDTPTTAFPGVLAQQFSTVGLYGVAIIFVISTLGRAMTSLTVISRHKNFDGMGQ